MEKLKYDECEKCTDWDGTWSNCMDICGKPDDALEEFNQYRAIGTLEECREAREKQRVKKPSVLVNDHDVKIGHAIYKKGTKTYKCDCGGWIGKIHKFCPDCGQAIDWMEEHNA